ncbi:sensor histidine kinase N-terminal domain-containing protein [Marinobacter sediminum]|uniref:ATP-binding protein n=1 Tax=Marinobacter sediminum TaxID=256323 RepID=UPI00202E33F0|nr:ATP-binding protein [Marinobacter sediminum]MCM0614112.1 sensor histidine kinase N-terminal domain-containing protein [Marinobacter sediminum]
MSLTRTLTLMVVTTVLLITLITASWGFYVSNHQLEELFDAELAQSTRIVQGLVQHLSDTQSQDQLATILAKTLQLPESALYETEDDEILPRGAGHKYEKKIAFEVWSPDREPLLDTLRADDALGLYPGFSWAEVTGFRWRTFTMKDPTTGFWIRTAQREDVRDELSEELALGNILPIFLALPLLVIAVIIAVQVGFRPLRRLERPVRYMAPERIHPLDERQAPKEVAGLVNAVNGLLRRLNQALERERRFSADAAHELRTPLTALRLNLEKLSDKHPDDFRGLTASVDRMVHLVEQMLLLSRVDSGTDFKPEPQNLSALVEQSIADVAPLALRKGIDPVLEDTARNAVVNCHSALIATLMRSLLANAIQYSPAGTQINTRIRNTDNGFSIRICDQGPGIPTDARERALSRFTRLDQRQGAGAGLGLAIARRIAELHKGSLTLSDRDDGQTGLCVEIWLPTSNASPELPGIS